jgi:signal transduction histidine kinase
MPEATSPSLELKWKGLAPIASDNSAFRILTVDDNEAIRYTLGRSLRDAGFQVLEARNGSEALARAAENPDLITLDVNLPDVHGFDLCRQLKSNPATSHIPILHLSSTFVDPESRVHGLASGADAYLAEPIDRAELVATIGALLRLKNAEMRARQQAEIAEAARSELASLNAALEQRVSERTGELRVANQSLHELSGRLLRMQDDERRRIARELHDGVGQLLVAIKMNNAIIEEQGSALDSRAAKALAENTSMLDELMRGVRTISHLLHPPLLDEAGLPSALKHYVDEFSERSGVNVVLDCDPDIGRLPADMETAFFRMTQECLGNVHRHAASQSASVRLRESEGRIHLQISDDGRGIPAEKQRLLELGGGGVGLRGMRERVAHMGGELQIHSTGEGTTVTATLPRPKEGLEEPSVA